MTEPEEVLFDEWGNPTSTQELHILRWNIVQQLKEPGWDATPTARRFMVQVMHVISDELEARSYDLRKQ